MTSGIISYLKGDIINEDEKCIDLVTGIFQNREAELVLSGVRFSGGCVFGDVGVNADDGDAFRFVICNEFLHTLVVGIGNRTLHRDKEQHCAVLSGQGLE